MDGTANAQTVTDAKSGFTAHDFRDVLEAQGITIRVKTPGREEKQALASSLAIEVPGSSRARWAGNGHENRRAGLQSVG